MKIWDSLGQLSILTTLDKKFKNKASKLEKLATAETVKDIYSILKKAKVGKLMNGAITQIEVKLPKNKISIKKLCAKYKWDYSKIIEKTGIKNVYHSSKMSNCKKISNKCCKKNNKKK